MIQDNEDSRAEFNRMNRNFILLYQAVVRDGEAVTALDWTRCGNHCLDGFFAFW